MTKTDEGSGLRVLVADDDPAIRMLVQRVFARRGYEVTTANDGADAIVHLDQNQYDLLVLDLMMPRVDGIGVIAHLQSRGAATPPILVMTAAAPDVLGRLPKDRIAKIITKPFDIDELVHDADEAIETSRVT